MTISERIARLESRDDLDERTRRDLDVIRTQIERAEARILKVARRRGSSTQPKLALVATEES